MHVSYSTRILIGLALLGLGFDSLYGILPLWAESPYGNGSYNRNSSLSSRPFEGGTPSPVPKLSQRSKLRVYDVRTQYKHTYSVPGGYRLPSVNPSGDHEASQEQNYDKSDR